MDKIVHMPSFMANYTYSGYS